MRHIPLLVTALCLQLGLSAADAPAPTTPPMPVAPEASAALATPDVLAKSWVEVLQRNDLTAGFGLLNAAAQTELTSQWQRAVAKPNPRLDAQIDELLRPVLRPVRRVARDAVASEHLLAMAKPYLEQIDVPALTKGLTEITGLLTKVADSQPAAQGGGLDYAGLRDWLQDFAAWLPSAGLTDQAKASTAIDHLITAVNATGLTSAAEFRAMPLPELLAKLGPALPAIKDALKLYDVRVDAFLESFTCTLVETTGDQAVVALGFQSLDKPRTIQLRLINRNNSWQLAPGNDNPLVGLSQLVMMGMLMQGMGADAPAQPPAAPPAAPADDGAL